jgi:hypothetical protein
LRSYPRVKFAEVLKHYQQVQYDNLPDANEMTRNNMGQTFKVWQMMPLPPEWTATFIDGPPFEEALLRFYKLPVETSKERLDEYAAFCYMSLMALCALQPNSDISTLSVAASKLIYTAPVQTYAARLWMDNDLWRDKDAVAVHGDDKDEGDDDSLGKIACSHNPLLKSPYYQSSNSLEEGRAKQHKKEEKAVTAKSRRTTKNDRREEEEYNRNSDASASKSDSSVNELSTSGLSTSESDNSQSGGAKSQQHNAVTPPLRFSKDSQWQDHTLELCKLKMKISRGDMRRMIRAMTPNSTAAGATGTPVSKLSPTRRTVLTACGGHDNKDSEFELPPLYAKLEAAGFTSEEICMALRRMCEQVQCSQHRYRVHVNKRMEKTVKRGNYSASNDRTYDGATAGVTLFATPHLSPKLIHEDEMDYQAFEDATHKMQADNKKFLAGQKFNPPKELSELIQVLNNYICWTENMFGNQFPHLLLVVRLRDVLDKIQDILKPKKGTKEAGRRVTEGPSERMLDTGTDKRTTIKNKSN